MTSIMINEIEAQLEKRVLFNVRLNVASGHFDFPLGIVDQGSGAANEIAVLNAALGLGEQLAAVAKQQLRAPRP